MRRRTRSCVVTREGERSGRLSAAGIDQHRRRHVEVTRRPPISGRHLPGRVGRRLPHRERGL